MRQRVPWRLPFICTVWAADLAVIDTDEHTLLRRTRYANFLGLFAFAQAVRTVMFGCRDIVCSRPARGLKNDERRTYH